MSDSEQQSNELWAGILDEHLVQSQVLVESALAEAIYDARPSHVKAIRTACLEKLDEIVARLGAMRDAAQRACDAELERQFAEMGEMRKELGLGKARARAKEEKDDAPSPAKRANGHATRADGASEARSAGDIA